MVPTLRNVCKIFLACDKEKKERVCSLQNRKSVKDNERATVTASHCSRSLLRAFRAPVCQRDGRLCAGYGNSAGINDVRL